MEGKYLTDPEISHNRSAGFLQKDNVSGIDLSKGCDSVLAELRFNRLLSLQNVRQIRLHKHSNVYTMSLKPVQIIH